MTDMTGEPKADVALPSATEIRNLVEMKKQQKEAEEARLRKAAAEEKKHQEELFLARKVTPDVVALIEKRIRDAAESGASELLLGQFPSDWCTDGGRQINVLEATWPDTLQGFAKEFYEFWERELKPKGFRLRAQIITFPGGVPGDVGVFLSWGE